MFAMGGICTKAKEAQLKLESVRTMFNTQTQEVEKTTIVGAVSRAVAESSAAFKEAIKQQLEEKQAEEARKLRQIREAKARDDVVDVKESARALSPQESITPSAAPNKLEASDTAAQAPAPVRGAEVDVKA